MSYDQWLYRPEPGAPSLTAWTRSHFQALGAVTELKQRFSELFPDIDWRGGPDYTWSAQGPAAQPQYSVVLSPEDEDGLVHIIALKGASQQDAVELAQKLGLCAYDPQKNEELT